MGLKSWVGILNFIFLEFYCFVILGVQFRYALTSGYDHSPDVRDRRCRSSLARTWATFCYWSYHVVTLFVLAAGIGWWREFLLRKDFSTQTTLKTARDFLKNQNELLEIEVKKRTRKMQETQDATIVMLASLVETRDNETGNHIRRTQHYVRALARQLQSHPAFAGYLAEHQIDMLFKSAPLHDIGKVGIPDSILLKPGKLDPEEFEIMKTHTTLGHDAIENAEKQLGMTVDFLVLRQGNRVEPSGKVGRQRLPAAARGQRHSDLGAPDGGGRRLRRADQPPRLQGRHAASTRRWRSSSKVGASHFDPDIVDAFLEIKDEFRDIAGRYSD